MTVNQDDSAKRLLLRERYRTLADDDLVRLAFEQNLVPTARDAITDELASRGLRDLSSFNQRFDEDAAIVKASNPDPIVPASVLSGDAKSSKYFGIAGFVLIGLIGAHAWLLGDAATWRREGTLFLWLFFALILTWDPIREVLKGRASRKLVCWLVLGLLYIVVTTSAMAVPAVGRFVGTLYPMVVLAIIAAPGIVGAVRDVASRITTRRNKRTIDKG